MRISNLQACVIGILVTLLGVGLKQYNISIPGYILITLGLTGIVGVFIFNCTRKKSQNLKHKTIFKDDFKENEGWEMVQPGTVLISDEKVYTGATALKKTGANDPAGGLKSIGQSIKRGFTFAGRIYRPSDGAGGPADRLSIEDRHGNGYGFSLRHDNTRIAIAIEKRREGAFAGNVVIEDRKPPDDPSLRNTWYYFSFQVTKNSLIVLNIDHQGHRIVHIQANDDEFKKFERIAVRGGYPYFVDDITITLT